MVWVAGERVVVLERLVGGGVEWIITSTTAKGRTLWPLPSHILIPIIPLLLLFRILSPIQRVMSLKIRIIRIPILILPINIIIIHEIPVLMLMQR